MDKSRSNDRRQVNKPVSKDRRGSGHDRRHECPQCHSPLISQVVKIATGTKQVLACTRCDWNGSSAQVDMKVLIAKRTWALPVESRGPLRYVALPHELLEAVGVNEGDRLVFKPLTLPVGSLAMKWSITVVKQNESA